MLKIIYRLEQLSRARILWFGLALLSLAFLTVALFYQYVLDEWPCVLCIQVRLWISLLLLTSLFAWLLIPRVWVQWLASGLMLLTAIGLTERSYLLLGTERGFVFRNCGFDLGLPGGIPLDQWLPWLFRVDASCGYTPQLLFGITMAEALMVFSVLFTVFSLAILASRVFVLFRSHA